MPLCKYCVSASIAAVAIGALLVSSRPDRVTFAAPAPSREVESAAPDLQPTASPDNAIALADAPAGASVSGHAKLDGQAPERHRIDVSKEEHCSKLHESGEILDEDVLVAADGSIKNVFVYIRRGAPKGDYPVPEEPVRVDQKGCMYSPRVQGIRVGQKLIVSNSDPLTHNVRSFTTRNRPFNLGQFAGSEPREKVFETFEREAVEITCDIHRWMRAYLFVLEHPFFAVTGEDGKFSIPNLPPGEYQLVAWHEKFGEQRQTIKVEDTAVGDVNFTFTPKKKK